MRISDWSSDVCSSDLWFAVDVSGETVSRTAAGQWREGAALNLERAMKLGDEMGGHIVPGHVDGVAEVIWVRGEGYLKRVAVGLARQLATFCAAKRPLQLGRVVWRGRVG